MKKYLLFAIIFNFVVLNCNSQFYCKTNKTITNLNLRKSISSALTNNSKSYCLRLYIHVIRKSNGTGGQSVYNVNQSIQVLNQDFNSHNIFFKHDNPIDYINNDALYNDLNSDVYSINNHLDGIDIYLGPSILNDSSGGGGSSPGIGTVADLMLTGNWYLPPYFSLVTSHVLSHKMGHLLFLYHTHHGTDIYDDINPTCQELVNGSNATVCGDYVVDTPADPNMNLNVSGACNWLGNDVDSNNQNYSPKVNNIMAYTLPTCMTQFSNGQGLRMRNAIESLPFLQAVVINNCSGCGVNIVPDLVVKDNANDAGIQPNTTTDILWASDDIWVRKQPDYIEQHENPEFNPSVPNYDYIKITNNSCAPSLGTEKVKLYWAKAGTGLSWPDNWDGVHYFPAPNQTKKLGKPIGTANIPIIASGQQKVIQMQFDVQNPNDYSFTSDFWHFCLLARIESTIEPLNETNDLVDNVTNNNAIAWKNLTVFNLADEVTNGTISVANVLDEPKSFDIDFLSTVLESGKPLFSEAEITIELSPTLVDAWTRGGRKSINFKIIRNDNILQLTGGNASIQNVLFDPKEIGFINVKVNFLTKELTTKEKYTFNVIEKNHNTGKVIGGETFVVKKQTRPSFSATILNNVEVNRNETINIAALQINEPALYNWYDSNGNLVYTGTDISISSNIATKYKLEIVALSDGFKDYSDVNVSLKKSAIIKLYPNPTDSFLSIEYKINTDDTSYFMIYRADDLQNISNYLVDNAETHRIIEVANFPIGLYKIALINNGQVLDLNNFTKN